MVKEANDYLRDVAGQLARHDATLSSHAKQLGSVAEGMDRLADELRDLRDVLHGDGKNTPGVISDLRDAGRSVVWMRRLAWLAGAQTVAIVVSLLFLAITLGISGAP